MKKLLLLFVCIISLCSCVDKEDNKNYPLNGTVWEVVKEHNGEVNQVKMTMTVTFSTETVKVKNVETLNGKTTETVVNAKYTYEPPKVVIIDGKDMLTGVIDGNKLTIEDLVLIQK